MLETLNHASFAEQLHTQFLAHVDDTQVVALELIQAEDLGTNATQERFSITLRGPVDRFLPQQIYALEHPVLGQLDLFLVPIARQAEGFHYEAVFNRLVALK